VDLGTERCGGIFFHLPNRLFFFILRRQRVAWGIDVLDLLKALVAEIVGVREIRRQDVAGRGDGLEPIRGIEVAVRPDPCNPAPSSSIDLCQPVGPTPLIGYGSSRRSRKDSALNSQTSGFIR
jgi:hypothetical protein